MAGPPLYLAADKSPIEYMYLHAIKRKRRAPVTLRGRSLSSDFAFVSGYLFFSLLQRVGPRPQPRIRGHEVRGPPIEIHLHASSRKCCLQTACTWTLYSAHQTPSLVMCSLDDMTGLRLRHCLPFTLLKGVIELVTTNSS